MLLPLWRTPLRSPLQLTLQFPYMLSVFLDMFSLIISSEGYILSSPTSFIKWTVRMRKNKWLKSLRYFSTIMVVKTMRAATKTSLQIQIQRSIIEELHESGMIM